MTMILYFLIGIVLVVSWYILKLLLVIIKPYRGTPLKQIPGPPNAHFLLGNALEIIKGPPMEANIQWANKYKSPLIYYRFLWNDDRILVVDPMLVQKVFNNPNIFSKKDLPGYSLLRFALGDGLITLNGEEHRKHRKLISPAFKHSNLKDLIHIFRDQTQILLQHLEALSGHSVCMNELMNKVTLNIIGFAGFGFDFSAFDPNPNTTGAKTYKAFSELISRHSVVSAFIPFLKYIPTPHNIKGGLNLWYLNKVVLELVKSKRASITTEEKQKPRDILDLLIASYDEETGFKLTDAQLSAHVKTFLGAGHETTSMLLTWTFYLLSQKREVVDKLRAEIRNVIGESNDFGLLEIEKLVYMGHVLKEVLRLYPPAAVVARRTTCDTTLGECFIPQSTVVIISPMVLGRVESAWENPNSFQPERWENDESHSYAHFRKLKKGPRNCIGQKFAMLEAKVILLMILRQFQFDMSIDDYQSVKTSLHVTLRPKEDMIMRLDKV